MTSSYTLHLHKWYVMQCNLLSIHFNFLFDCPLTTDSWQLWRCIIFSPFADSKHTMRCTSSWRTAATLWCWCCFRRSGITSCGHCCCAAPCLSPAACSTGPCRGSASLPSARSCGWRWPPATRCPAPGGLADVLMQPSHSSEWITSLL